MAVVDPAEVRSLRVRLLLPLALVGGVVAVGTLGYYWLWRGQGGTWMDALFMTVTTITTIGYGEVKPLSTRSVSSWSTWSSRSWPIPAGGGGWSVASRSFEGM